MLTEAEIREMAILMVRRYGAGAACQPTNRGREALDRGDADGSAIWRRIHEAVGRLQASEPGDDRSTS